MKNKTADFVITIFLSLNIATPVIAQGNVIEEIIVTAQKRQESLQDVPITISAFNSDRLDAMGVSSPEDLQHAVPGLIFSASNGGALGLVTMRGVGGDAVRGSTPGRNPAVPVHIDGVYLQSPSTMVQDFLDVERVEVLRGPQGTLYGRNAVGGSINIITKGPAEEFEGEVGIDIGNYDKRRVHAVLSGPLTERLRARVAFANEDRDGYVKNVLDPDDDELLNSDYSYLRGSVEYDLTDDILVRLNGWHYENDGANFVIRASSLPSPGSPISIYTTLPAGFSTVTTRGDVRKVEHDSRGSGKDTSTGFSADITWDFENMSLRSISAFVDTETSLFYDVDNTSVAGIQSFTDFAQNYEAISQEFQLSSSSDDKLQWILGLYYYTEESDSFSDFILNGPAFPPAFGPPIYPVTFQIIPPVEVESESIAVFGQLDYRISEKLNLTGGLRYTRDEMDVLRSQTLAFAGFPLVSAVNVPNEDDWSEVTWKLGANYDLTDDAMVYFSYSRGYKSGGFNVQDFNTGFDPEILDAYEFGVKSQWFENSVQFNASVFYYDYSDKQESNVNVIGTTLFENAGAATLIGAELELLAKLSDGIAIDASLSYLDTEYDEFNSADPENLALGIQDLSGNELPVAPEFQFHLGAQYTLPLSGDLGNLSARIDYSWTDDKFVRPFNAPTDLIDSYDTINARLWWESNDGSWVAEFYGANLEDEDIVDLFATTTSFSGFLHLETYLPPRTYGFKLTYRF